MTYPTTFSDQKTAMEALDAELTTYLADTLPIPVSGSTPPTQKEFEAAWVAAGKTLPIQPDRDFLWYDGRILRGQYSAMRDYLFPLAGNYSLDEYGTNTNVTALRRAWWEDDWHLIVSAFYKGVTSLMRMYLDGYYELITANVNVLTFNRTSQLAYYLNGTQLTSLHVVTGTSTGLTTTTAATAPAMVARSNGDLYFNDGTAGQSNRLIKKRTAAGVVTTIYDASVNYVGSNWAVFEMFHIAASSHLLVVMFDSTTNQYAVFRITDTGTTFTQLIAPQTGFGRSAGYSWTGGYYVSGDTFYWIAGSSNSMSTAKTITISTGVAGADSVLDYGSAKDTYKEALAEGIVSNLNYQVQQSAPSQYPGINLPRAFTDVSHRMPSPNQKTWLIVTPTNAGNPSHQWWVLGDPTNAYQGSLGRMYTMTAFHNGLPDFYRVATLLNDGARQELILDWSDADTQARLADYDIIQIVFDNWLNTADDTIRIQLNGDTGNNYLFSQWTISAATITNTNNSAQASVQLPGRFNATFFGGAYILTFIDFRSTDNHRYMLIEGGTQTGITTTTMRATLGVGIWQNTAAPTSIRIFLTGTGVFPAGVQVSLIGLKTRARYRRTDPIYAPYLG